MPSIPRPRRLDNPHSRDPESVPRAVPRDRGLTPQAKVITGFNTDVKYRGTVYHVQTEDKGAANPLIETLIYKGGEINRIYEKW